MNIARVLYPVQVLGPGNRVGIWMCGCTRHCPSCSNPELWERKPRYEISVGDLLHALERILENRRIDGFVISGGEPFEQSRELAELLAALTERSDDILVYTGYTYEELKGLGDEAVEACLRHISVLIDGAYLREQNRGALLRGSENQRIRFLDPVVIPRYQAYFQSTDRSRVQNFPTKDGVISVGIHREDFRRRVGEEAEKRGVLIHG